MTALVTLARAAALFRNFIERIYLGEKGKLKTWPGELEDFGDRGKIKTMGCCEKQRNKFANFAEGTIIYF